MFSRFEPIIHKLDVPNLKDRLKRLPEEDDDIAKKKDAKIHDELLKNLDLLFPTK